ncbi:MAG: carbamoyl-phosphate synthase large subunit [Verrucomicrobiales bacterium]|jgi:carbamoyl-phosphate synthase large subunit
MAENILITSAGRRGKLVRIFQEAAPAKVFTTDLRPELASACVISDGSFEVPRVTEADYIPRILEICQANEIGLIVPTIDTELLVLAENRERFAEADIKCVVSDPALIRICRDKRLTHDFFIERGLGSPALNDPRDDPKFPLFAKPYDGSCSINLHVLSSETDLTPALLDDSKLIFLDYLDPADHDEYTIDMFYDRDGNLRCLVPRLRLETRGGEVSKGRTIWLPAFEKIRQQLLKLEGARGCLTAQFFHHRESDEIYGIEINPRFGGGFPLSCDAGANYADWVIREYLRGESIDWFDGWERDLTMLRYDDHVLVRNSDS